MMDKLQKRFGDMISEVEESIQPAIWVTKENLLRVMEALKEEDEFNFKLLADLTGADYEDHMEVVYHLMNLDNCQLLRVKTKLDKNNPEVDSLSKLWKAAVIQEREAYDLLGIKFAGHPNLKRILCPDDFEGHALRKDFKLNQRAAK
jgi:NADH-quinone oxidoreductase subunit C